MKIAIVGIGIIGSKLAEQILKVGEQIIVYNRTNDKTDELQQKGAVIVSHISNVVDMADYILLTLSDFTAIEQCLFRKEYALNNKRIIQMGTISPDQSSQLKERVARLGGEYLECPVLGSKREIEDQSIIMMVGAPQELYQSCKPVLEKFGTNIYYIGEVGQAAALKLALNQLIASHAAGFALSLGIVNHNNIDVDIFKDILSKSALYAPMFEKKLENWNSNSYANPNFTTKHLLKDTELIIKHAQAKNLNTGCIRAIKDIIEQAMEQGLGDLDYSSIFKTITRKS